MRILLLGSGGREHALARALTASDRDQLAVELFCAPGNIGIADHATLVEIDPTDGQAVAQWAQEHRVDLVVIGPEAPLIAGVADVLRKAGIAVFGPSQAAAQLEGSKAFAKDVMAAAGVPTARCVVCTSPDQVDEALASFTPPYVVKNDGLAAGKGVVVTEDVEVARSHAAECLRPQGGAVVIEDYLDGPEVSLFCVTDGRSVVPLAPAQDFKRIGDGDTGPNTGGMGAYSPLPWLGSDFSDRVVEQIAQPVVEEMARRGTPFVGLLYCGLACTSRGTQVVEFNARFGDPETQVVLPRLRSPLAELLYAAARGTLDQLAPLQWSDESAVGVVLAAQDYPRLPVLGDVITGIEDANAMPGVHVDVAGARREDDRVVTSGGRVVNVCALGPDLAQARDLAYRAAAAIEWRGMQLRTDIAARAIAGKLAEGRS